MDALSKPTAPSRPSTPFYGLLNSGFIIFNTNQQFSVTRKSRLMPPEVLMPSKGNLEQCVCTGNIEHLTLSLILKYYELLVIQKQLLSIKCRILLKINHAGR